MTRLSGIRLLALSFVLWALAVWIFGTSHPPGTETAATDTTVRTPGEETEASAAGASDSARAEATTGHASAGPADQPADQGAIARSKSGTGADTAAPQATSGHTGVETAAASSPSAAPAVTPGPGAPVPAAPADRSHIALAPAPTPAPTDAGSGADTAISPPATEAGAVAGRPITPVEPVPAPPREGTVGPGAPNVPTASVRSHPWTEQPPSRPPPPAPSGLSATDGNAVGGQLDAARRAAWEGRLADALAHYRTAARLRPDDYVVWGEMGNVLWTMQRWPEAAYALEGAATLLVRAGELRAASELVPAVGRIDPDAAYRVQRLLWTAAQRRSG